MTQEDIRTNKNHEALLCYIRLGWGIHNVIVNNMSKWHLSCRLKDKIELNRKTLQFDVERKWIAVWPNKNRKTQTHWREQANGDPIPYQHFLILQSARCNPVFSIWIWWDFIIQSHALCVCSCVSLCCSLLQALGTILGLKLPVVFPFVLWQSLNLRANVCAPPCVCSSLYWFFRHTAQGSNPWLLKHVLTYSKSYRSSFSKLRAWERTRAQSFLSPL